MRKEDTTNRKHSSFKIYLVDQDQEDEEAIETGLHQTEADEMTLAAEIWKKVAASFAERKATSRGSVLTIEEAKEEIRDLDLAVREELPGDTEEVLHRRKAERDTERGQKVMTQGALLTTEVAILKEEIEEPLLTIRDEFNFNQPLNITKPMQ